MPDNQLSYANGIVAILDALGLKTTDRRRIYRFYRARERVLDLLRIKTKRLARNLEIERVSIFTFNDTVLISLRSREDVLSDDELTGFFALIRKFMIDSLGEGIFFRGSIAIGDFYSDDETNTILGDAVADAASWYDVAEWIGVLLTPRSSIYLDSRQNSASSDWLRSVLIYDVPLKSGDDVSLKTINWPKLFRDENLSPCRDGEKPREKICEMLSGDFVPQGTENKYFNTIKFFDYEFQEYKKRQIKKRKATP